MKNIWVPLSGQIAQQRKVETIANNIANANTAGFKKDDVSFKEYLTVLNKGQEDIDLPNKEFSPEDFYKTQSAENAKVEINGTYTVFEQGQLTPTGNPLDLAIHGDGFFEVLTPAGIRFTRKGILGLSKDGELVTEEGYKVLSKNTALASQGRDLSAVSNPVDRIIKVPTDQKISVTIDGKIFSGAQPLQELSVVSFKSNQLLRKESGSLFLNLVETNLKSPEDTKVHQGFVEGSNVNTIHEMSELIKAHRHFDNIQKAIQTYDNITGRAVNDISKF
jgi:flagellar basal-body rod protein FlgF